MEGDAHTFSFRSRIGKRRTGQTGLFLPGDPSAGSTMNNNLASAS
jgi:hypothetical protein